MMKKFTASLFMTFLCLILTAIPVIWNFEGSTNVASQVPTGVSASTANFGTGLNNILYSTGFSGGLAYEAKGWTNQNSPNADHFIEICITNNSGSSFTIDHLGFNESRSADGVSLYDIEYSIDMGSSMSIGSGSIPDNTSWRSHNFTLSINLDNGSEICIKVFGYDAENGSSTWKFDNINISGNGALPVHIASFNATSNATSTQLSWITASEINNDYFEIEHSTNNLNFKYIGYVNGSGNSNDYKNYEFTHKSSLTKTNYYRLKQFDLDGSYSYSNIISSKWEQTIDRSFYFYPTIANKTLNVHFEGNEASLTILSLNGEILLRKNIINQSLLEISHLTKGIYIILTQVDDQLFVDRMVKS